MGVVDSKTSKERIYSVEEIKKASNEMRAYILLATHCAGSGHPGGSLSSVELIASAFLNKLKHDPKNPAWQGRDRFFLSKAHIVPALYAALVYTSYYSLGEMVTLRQLWGPFQGHSDRNKCKGIELSAGSLGQGLGAAIGSALAAKINNEKHRVFCLMGDGEQQEGSVWEAAMSAYHFKLDNLIAIVDRNRLQIDGCTEDVMCLDSMAEKYKGFGWNVLEIDGHDIEEILDAYDLAERNKGRPTVIIAHTTKGKGISFMENKAEWHGKAPNKDQLIQSLKELNSNIDYEKYIKIAKQSFEKIDAKVKEDTPKFSKDYWWNSSDKMKVQMEPTRFGFGKALNEIGDDKRIVTLHADISDSIKITDFEKGHPERLNRVFSIGIAEQNMMSVAAGLAKEGKIPIAGTYGVFASGRPWDQIRTTICYNNLNVKIGGAHGGISVGPDGATHQSLEEIPLMYYLPNMHLFVPADSIETYKITKKSILDINGPCYLRFGREAMPIVTKPDTYCAIGDANVIRYRKESANFIDAFEIKQASKHKNENEKLAIIACGTMVAESMRAAYILKEEFGIETRVINIHSVKPIDRKAIVSAMKETSHILTVEEHQVGGFGNIIAGIIAEEKKPEDKFKMKMLGIKDRFGESGEPWQLMRYFGLSAEHIAKAASEFLKT
ncbi:MAG: transketolase [Candidatus Diapherotrites archaeon CG08_land_8_20_14_0_20_34_12]|nr:MAG: transketolase [Candidatus Diapherotrites archaeon CG08_land_8_20_14_0_20_34_12]